MREVSASLPAAQCLTLPNTGDFPIEIKSTPKNRHGFGVFASKNIKKDQIVFIEAPLFLAPESAKEYINSTKWLPLYCNYALTADRKRAQFKTLEQKCFCGKSKACREPDFVKIWNANVFTMDLNAGKNSKVTGHLRCHIIADNLAESNENEKDSGNQEKHEEDSEPNITKQVYAVTARLNHSCHANAYATALPPTPKLMNCIVMRALTDISQGTEITISYLPSLFGTTTARRERLQEKCHFECTCKACRKNLDVAVTTAAVAPPLPGIDRSNIINTPDSHAAFLQSKTKQFFAKLFAQLPKLRPISVENVKALHESRKARDGGLKDTWIHDAVVDYLVVFRKAFRGLDPVLYSYCNIPASMWTFCGLEMFVLFHKAGFNLVGEKDLEVAVNFMAVLVAIYFSDDKVLEYVGNVYAVQSKPIAEHLLKIRRLGWNLGRIFQSTEYAQLWLHGCWNLDTFHTAVRRALDV